MNKIKCLITTLKIQGIAKQLGISDSYATNLVSTIMSKYQLSSYPTIQQCRDYMNNNAEEQKLISLAIPVYYKREVDSNQGAFIENEEIVLASFKIGTSWENAKNVISNKPYFNKYSKLLTDFKSFYTFELYAVKEAKRTGNNTPTEANYEKAAQLLERAKKEFPNEFPQVKKSDNTYTEIEGLTNKAGDKVLASTNSENEIKIEKNLTIEEFFNYIQGKLDSTTSKQKEAVFNALFNITFNLADGTTFQCTIDNLKSLITSIEDAKSFLYYHEKSHITNKDKDNYWKQGEDLMTQDKIDIETRATRDAVAALLITKGANIKSFGVLNSNTLENNSKDNTSDDKIQQLSNNTTGGGLKQLYSTVRKGVIAKEDEVEIPANRPKVGIEVLNVDKTNRRARLIRDFNPVELRNRSTAIARGFSTLIDSNIRKLTKQLSSQLGTATEKEKEAIQEQLQILKDYEKNRAFTILKVGFKPLYEKLKKSYEDIANASVEDLEKLYGDKATEIKAKYQAIVNNFEALFEDAAYTIEINENLKIDFKDADNTAVTKATQEQENEDNFNSDDENGEAVTGNDGWSFKVRFINPFDTLSTKVKKVLAEVIKVDAQGKEVKDDLGNPINMSVIQTYTLLADKLSSMIDSDDFMINTKDPTTGEKIVSFPALEELSKRYPWVNQIIKKLKKDPQLASMFYSNFRNDFINYWKQRYNIGEYKTEHFPLNKPAASESTSRKAIANYEQGNVISDTSVYDNNLKLNTTNAENLLNSLDKIQSTLQQYSEEDSIEIAEATGKALRSIGFSIMDSEINAILDTETGIEDIKTVVRNLIEILDGVSSLDENESLTTVFRKQYDTIAEKIGDVDEYINVQSFRDHGKSYQSYSAPNYMDTLFKKLSNGKRYMQLLEEEFKPYAFFYNESEGKWLNHWLHLIESDEDVRNNIKLKELNNINDIEYNEWTPSMIKDAFMLEYFSLGEAKGAKTQYAYYNFPILSDSPVAKFIKFVRYTDNFKETLTPLIADVIKQEMHRISVINERKDKGIGAIQNFDKQGGKFLFFPELNTYTIGDKSFIEAAKEAANESTEALDNLLNSVVTDIMNNKVLKALQDPQVSSLLSVLIEQDVATTKEGALDKYVEYLWNNTFAQSQIIQLTTTDLAYYKNLIDFQKRYKEIYAAGKKLNTNSRYGRKIEKTIYLSDKVITSRFYSNIKANLNKAVKEGRLKQEEAQAIINKYKEINVTDAQAYRSLDSYRAVLDMAGMWTEDMEDAFNRFNEGTWDMRDFTIVYQTLKPFVYTQIQKEDGIGGLLKVPHQNKNSEFALMAIYSLLGTSLNTSNTLKGINTFMKDSDIDVVQFESAVKAGGQGIIDISTDPDKVAEVLKNKSISINGIKYRIPKEVDNFKDIKKYFDDLLDKDKISQNSYNNILDYFEPSEERVVEILRAAVYDENNEYKENVVHQLPYESYVIQQPTPEHLFDAESVYGSQFNNLIYADLIDPNMEVTVNGETIKGRDNIIKYYHALRVENLLESYAKVSKKFTTIEDLQRAILETIKGNPKYGRDMEDALQIVEVNINGVKRKTFNIPLHNPTMTDKIQEIVLSMFKNGITKQKIKGAKCTLVSNFGFTKKLNILRNDDGSLIGAECYMPFHSRAIFKDYLTPVYNKQGKQIGEELDIEAIKAQDPELLKAVGYRIPTEAKYSMLPLIIKGFLPVQNGSSIMLPADITTIAGCDFDVDGLFMMLPEFDIIKYNKGKAIKVYKQVNNIEGDVDTNSKEFKDWYKEHKEEFKYDKPKIKKVKAKEGAKPEEMNRRQRNNKLIDLSYAILTHPDVAEHFNSPGSFDKLKKAARIAEITSNIQLTEAWLANNEGKSIEDLLKESLDNLNKFIEKYQEPMDPLSVDTFAYFHKQNTTGGKLIGIYANNTTMQAKYQLSELSLIAGFNINGRVLNSIHDAYIEIDGIKERISKNCAEFSAASVDNVKDPVLAKLMQNTETAKVAGFMLRAGFTIEEIGLLFNSPDVKRCIELYGNLSKESIDLYLGSTPVEVSISVINSTGLIKNTVEYYKVKDEMKHFENDQEIQDYLQEHPSDEDVLSYSLGVLHYMNLIARNADALAEATRINRADSPNGAVSVSLAGALNQIYRVRNFHDKAKEGSVPFTGTNTLIKTNVVSFSANRDQMRAIFNESNMPMLQAFFTLGIESSTSLMAPYFAQLSRPMRGLIETLYNYSAFGTLSDNDLIMLFRDFNRYALSNTTVFGKDDSNSFEEKRNYYINQFAKDFDAFLKDPANKDIKALGIMKNIGVKDNKVILTDASKVTKLTKELYQRDLNTLLYMDEKAQQLALDLYMYEYYTNGLAFGPTNVGNFFDSNFLNSIPEVINSMREEALIERDPSFYSNFLNQFYMNRFKESNTLLPLIYKVNELDSNTIAVERKTVYSLRGNYGVRALVKYKNNLYKLKGIPESKIATYELVETKNLRYPKYDANTKSEALMQNETNSEIRNKEEYSEPNFDELDALRADEEASRTAEVTSTTPTEEFDPKEGLENSKENPCNFKLNNNE